MTYQYTWASEAFKKGCDSNREVSHTKCQWSKNVRAEAAKSF